MKKQKENPLPSKVKYAESGLKSAVRYLDDPALSGSTKGVMEKFLATLAYKGWINKIKLYANDRKATSSISKDDAKEVWPEFLPESLVQKQETLAQNPEAKIVEEGGGNV